MCLILFSYKKHPRYKLIVIGNRDEFYNRPTAPADYWQSSPSVMAGRDLEAGGTWMGINQQTGNIAMLTNYRDLDNLKHNAPTRGHLVSDFLKNDQQTIPYYDTVKQKLKEYNGFNMILGTSDELYYFSNQFEGLKKLEKGIYGLSNALLNSSWQKVNKGKLKLEAITEHRHFEIEHLFEAMYDDVQAEDKHLPDTGVGLEKERMLSSMFIKSPQYGSRCTTVILIDNHDKVLFAERTFDLKDFSYNTVYHKLAIGE